MVTLINEFLVLQGFQPCTQPFLRYPADHTGTVRRGKQIRPKEGSIAETLPVAETYDAGGKNKDEER